MGVNDGKKGCQQFKAKIGGKPHNGCGSAGKPGGPMGTKRELDSVQITLIVA